jgi:hypothetical protein
VRKVLLLLLVLGGILAPCVSADDTGYFPESHELFQPLLADPRELQYALRLIVPVSHNLLGEAAIGDYLGIYRWSLGGGGRAQVSMGGGVFGRFKLATSANEMQVADFYANLPFDWRIGSFSGRFMMYHTSSHLGDDYLAEHGGTTSKHSWDNLRWLASYDTHPYLRLYAGYNYIFRELPGHLGRNALQGGFEMYAPRGKKGHARAYWANDFQSWERSNWNPMFSSQLGVKITRDSQSRRGTAFFLEFMTGRQPHGQFFLEEETRWGLGIKFDLS